MNLYSIDQEFIHLQALLESSDGELTEELELTLKYNEANIDKKYKNYVHMILNLESDIDSLDKEIARLTALKKPKSSAIDRLKDNLKESMQLREIDKFDGGTFKLSFRKSSGVKILDESLIPNKYLVKVTTISPDKKLIGDTIKAGKIVPGATIYENKNLQLK